MLSTLEEAASMTTVIGIDIGAQGALALLTREGDLIDVVDMPILRDGPKNRPSVNGPLLAPIIRRWQRDSRLCRVRRRASWRGSSRRFRLRSLPWCRGGRSRRLWRSRYPHSSSILEARSWTRLHRQRTHPVRKPFADGLLMPHCSPASKDDGRAESALIGVAGLLRRGGGP